jgi:serine/threonine protein kinase
MLIVEYANNGNLRECLTEITSNWYQKLLMLYKIINGLNEIHKNNLIHYDFYDGNILCNKYEDSKYAVFINNYLKSFQLAKSFLKKDNIYGVIPFIAPEVLKGKPYIQASNIYSFSIIMWEFTSKIPPFNNRAHDIQLALSICKGERPEIIKNTPQCYIDLMKKCWDEDPLKRPSASEILDIIEKWIFQPSNMNIKNINKELKNNIIEFINAPIEHNNPITEFHPQAYYKSCLHNFTSEKLNVILEGPLKIFELKENAEQKLLKLEMIAETYYESSQMEFRIKQKELKEMHLTYQKIKLELVNLQQKNFQLEQNYQNSTEQIKEFTEKENTLQAQITYLQNGKQALADDLAKQLEQNKLTNHQTSQLEQEKNNLQDQLVNLQQKNFQLEQNYQNSTEQIKEFTEKENTLQAQITYLQNEKQALTDDLAKQLEQNKLTNQQTSQLEQEKNNLQDQLVNLQQKNFQLEQNYQNSTEQIKEFADKENTLQVQITYLQNEKQALADDLAKQLKQNKLTNQQDSQLEQEKNSLQNQLFQVKANIQELKSQLESLFKQKEQLENKLSQFQQQIEEEKIFKDNMLKALLQAQELTNKEKDEKAELKAKLEKEIAQLKEQIKEQLTHILQIKDKINELEKKLVIPNQECIKQPEKEILASYDDNRKKQILNQVNKFLKAKGDFLTLREETIKKLQKQYEVISDRIAINIIGEVVSETKKFQDILVECNEIGLFQMDEDHNSLMNIIQENKELEVSLKINNILKVDSFDLNKYKIFTIATNSWEETKSNLDSNIMAEDIKSLKKNLGELKSELRQQKKELKNLVD